mgnify:CR=1 FL=1
MKDLEEAREYFAKDRFATENGAVIAEAGPGYAVCTLELQPRHRNALGNVMGGAVFMLGDFAFAVASNFGGRTTVSTTSQITFLRSAKGDRLKAKAELVREGRTSVYYEISVWDEFENLVARLTASGAVLGS